jgi:hypothetical protein
MHNYYSQDVAQAAIDQYERDVAMFRLEREARDAQREATGATRARRSWSIGSLVRAQRRSTPSFGFGRHA